MTDVTRLPNELKNNGLFCVWKYEERDGRQTKVPYNPRTGGRAQSTNPATFAPAVAAETVQGNYNGMGIGVFNDICAIDIDDCVDDEGHPDELTLEIMSTMDSYTEYSPSGRGIRIIFKAPGFVYDKSKYYINNQKLGLEVYVAGATNKYVTVTGDVITPCDELPDRSAELQIILDKYMQRKQPEKRTPKVIELYSETDTDQQIIRKAERAKNGALFSRLFSGDWAGYPSQSEADQALCNLLAFWTGRDPEQMERLFRQSGLYREKDDNHPTYLRGTIRKAIDGCSEIYTGPIRTSAKEDFGTALKVSGDTTLSEMLFDLNPALNDRYGWHDLGNGNLFADCFRGLARYVPERKKWFIYNGKTWRPDTGSLRVMELCKKLADGLMIYALSLPDERQRRAYMEFCGKWQKRNYRETILKDAASVYPVALDTFDTNPMLFNCLNGTLDLSTGEFYTHRPADMLSKISGVAYDPEARCKRWERFIDEVMQGDRDKASFLQKALGYALTGDTRHECFFMLYGPASRNGKGTCMETFMRLMGDYGKTAKPETIAQKQTANGSGPSEDIARLTGARFVNISEPDKKLVLSAALVKTLTGNDTISARFLNENSFEYKPQFKLFINTNHLPAVTDTTLFTSGRVLIIPFERHFSENERDKGLKTELTMPGNMSGILNWCLAGLRALRENGFNIPDSVKAATDEYRRHSDKVGRFLEDEMYADFTAETRTSDAYARYQRWCSLNGFYPENAANFKSLLSNITTVSRKRPAGSGRGASPTTLILGYRLKYDFETDFAG